MFKHKEIVTGQFDNNYLKKVDENIFRLRDIYDGKISYISDDYALLIGTFEKLYKGVTQELNKIHHDMPENLEYHFSRHRFSYFLDYINSHIPLSDSLKGYDQIYDNCCTLENDYTNARYEFRTKEEFYTAYRKLEYATSKLYNNLSDEIAKNTLTKEDEQDLGYWE